MSDYKTGEYKNPEATRWPRNLRYVSQAVLDDREGQVAQHIEEELGQEARRGERYDHREDASQRTFLHDFHPFY